MELTDEQRAAVRETARKAAEIMEPIPPCGFIAWKSPGGWWRYNQPNPLWVPLRLLDGSSPDSDAVACARMKAWLIDRGAHTIGTTYSDHTEGAWREVDPSWGIYIVSDSVIFTRGGPTEVLAVADTLIAVDEKRSSPEEAPPIGDGETPTNDEVL